MINLKNLIFYINLFDKPVASWEEPINYCHWSSSITKTKNTNKIILSYLITFLTPMILLGLVIYIYSISSNATIKKDSLMLYIFIVTFLIGMAFLLGFHDYKSKPKQRRVFITKKAIQLDLAQSIPYGDILEYNITNIIHNQNRVSILLILIKSKRSGFTIGMPLNIQMDDIHKILSPNIKHNDKLSLSES